jgi:hypothetical protein
MTEEDIINTINRFYKTVNNRQRGGTMSYRGLLLSVEVQRLVEFLAV